MLKKAPIERSTPLPLADDFNSVVRRPGCGEDKGFEVELGNLAKAGTRAKQRPK